MDSKVFIDRFISFVEREHILWDKKNDLYGNETARDSAWEHIATKLNEGSEGGYVKGECLNKLWTSLTEVHEQYINNPKAVNFEYVKEMAFLGKQKTEELFLLKISEKKALLKHIIANVVLFVIYAYMLSNKGFMAQTNCNSNSSGFLMLGWIASTGLASIAACWTIFKDQQFRKNFVPIVILAVYAGICIVFLLMEDSPLNMNCSSEGPAFVAMVFIGFPVSILLSLLYHFVKITNKSSLLACLKTLCATYFGSALMFILFIATINWTPSYFLFPVWMIMNGKFAIDALCLSWKKRIIEPKDRYTVFWNATTDQFEIVLNGTNPNHLSDILVVTDVEDVVEIK